MSLKQEIETWVTALAHYDNNEFDDALKDFDGIADTSKILFNMGVIHATLGEHEKAVDCYARAVKLDQYLAVAYFQQGVSNFLMGDFEEALANFNDTLLYLRGNNNIDYEQLGLKFKLYSCEVLFNRGLCYIYLQQKDAGMQDLSFAAKEKVVPDHDVIEEAIREEAEGYTVFSIPVGIVYRPNDAKVKNLKTKDYLGKARLVAATDRANAFTGFTGSEIKKLQQGTAKDDRPDEKISFAATNLVKPNLQSRSRQASEPPLNRNVFPPTPPPDNDRPLEKYPNGQTMTRAQSVRGGGPKPMPLDLGRAAFPQGGGAGGGDRDRGDRGDKPRPSRSVSERPSITRDSSVSSGTRGSRSDRERDRDTREQRGDRGPRRRMVEEDDDAYSDELYDMYQPQPRSNRSTYSSRRGGGSKVQKQMYIEEEEEDDYDNYDEEPEFEMISRSKTGRRSQSRGPPSVRSAGGGSSAGGGGRISKIRVKVHSDDTRYVLIKPNIDFLDFADQIREKFGFRKDFKIKIKDDGDMITMSDQDDLDMALSNAKANARREGNDMGKMEVWVQMV